LPNFSISMWLPFARERRGDLSLGPATMPGGLTWSSRRGLIQVPWIAAAPADYHNPAAE